MQRCATATPIHKVQPKLPIVSFYPCSGPGERRPNEGGAVGGWNRAGSRSPVHHRELLRSRLERQSCLSRAAHAPHRGHAQGKGFTRGNSGPTVTNSWCAPRWRFSQLSLLNLVGLLALKLCARFSHRNAVDSPFKTDNALAKNRQLNRQRQAKCREVDGDQPASGRVRAAIQPDGQGDLRQSRREGYSGTSRMPRANARKMRSTPWPQS